MSFKEFSYLELWQPLCSAEKKKLCHFVKRHHEEQFCEIILNLDLRFMRRCRVRWSGTICALLVEGIMGNIIVKLCQIWTSGSGGDVV